ncbi:MAG: thermonuclease family protein [Flavisolibacter sp.]|nr:thermonuclease family protein [Flavisolibacter sp.]
MKLLFLFIVFLHVVSCSTETDSKTIYGKVVSIADGDTFTLLSNENKQIKIRLHGIDCPEKKQDFGQVAKQKLSDLIFGKTVRVVQKDIDRYKRIVALVYDEQNNCINTEMLKAGLAWHYTKYDQNPEWQQLENSARANHLGLWSQPSPTPPWEWRKNN